MKKLTLLLTLLLALVSSHTLLKAAAPADTLIRYYIDGRRVAHFDGSQLKGKTIVSYQIESFTHPEEGPVRVHNIFTADSNYTGDAQEQPTIRIRTIDGSQPDPAYVIDGKQISKKEFEKLDPSDIKSMTVVKGGTQEDVKKYDGWENGVILVETKSGAKKK